MDAILGGRLTRGLCAALALAVAGCASVPRSDLQTLEIETVLPTGAPVAGARCVLSNALGEWSATAPGKVMVSTDASPLQLRCEAGDATRGEHRAPADVRGGRWGRGLAGGGVGLALGGLIGADSDRGKEPGFCCKGLGAPIGAMFGALIGSAVGAASAEPRYAYPAKLRVVMQPASLPR